MTDNVLETITTACPELQILDLTRCSELTDDGLIHIATCANLQSLNLTGCRLTDETLQKILTKCQKLQHIVVDHCTFLTAQ